MTGTDSPDLTELKPVVLGNDDFDDDTTFVKEVAQSEFLRIETPAVSNVSNIHSVQVTQDNVNEIYKSIDGSHSQLSTFQCGQADFHVPDSDPDSQTEDTQDAGMVPSDPLSVDNLLSLVGTFYYTSSSSIIIRQ